MQLYPNPAKGRVSVSWDEPSDGQIRILSAEGKELQRVEYTQVRDVEIVTSGLPQGWCTVVRLDKDGKVMETEKLIIK